MFQFHTRERLFNHLRYSSSVCKLNVMLGERVLDEEGETYCDELDKVNVKRLVAKGFRRHDASLNAFRIPAPLKPVILEPGRETHAQLQQETLLHSSLHD